MAVVTLSCNLFPVAPGREMGKGNYLHGDIYKGSGFGLQGPVMGAIHDYPEGLMIAPTTSVSV